MCSLNLVDEHEELSSKDVSSKDTGSLEEGLRKDLVKILL
jgi:hypothetical protein